MADYKIKKVPVPIPDDEDQFAKDADKDGIPDYRDADFPEAEKYREDPLNPNQPKTWVADHNRFERVVDPTRKTDPDLAKLEAERLKVEARAAYEAHVEAYRAKSAADHKGAPAEEMAKFDLEAIEAAKAAWTGTFPDDETYLPR